MNKLGKTWEWMGITAPLFGDPENYPETAHRYSTKFSTAFQQRFTAPVLVLGQLFAEKAGIIITIKEYK